MGEMVRLEHGFSVGHGAQRAFHFIQSNRLMFKCCSSCVTLVFQFNFKVKKRIVFRYITLLEFVLCSLFFCKAQFGQCSVTHLRLVAEWSRGRHRCSLVCTLLYFFFQQTQMCQNKKLCHVEVMNISVAVLSCDHPW